MEISGGDSDLLFSIKYFLKIAFVRDISAIQSGGFVRYRLEGHDTFSRGCFHLRLKRATIQLTA